MKKIIVNEYKAKDGSFRTDTRTKLDGGKRKQSSNKWLQRHINDKYVKMASANEYISRSVYKLIEIEKKYNIFHNAKRVADLGCSPGGWLQFILECLEEKEGCFILGVDILDIRIFNNDVTFIKGDFSDADVLNSVYEALDDKKLDLIVSDMAPDLMGIKEVARLQSARLINDALNFADKMLNKNGNIVIKCIAGSEQEDDIIARIKKKFQKFL